MRIADVLRFDAASLRASPSRTALILLAMAIGVAAVIVLTSLGEGARQYVIGQFRLLGSNLLFVLPGKSETTGGMPPVLGTSPRDLTIDDARALRRHPLIDYAAPMVVGAVPVSHGSREREATVFGTSADLKPALGLKITGRFFEPRIEGSGAAQCVIGVKLARELFDNRNPLGRRVHIGDYRFQVIGVLGSRAMSVGVDMSEGILIPVSNALAMFNRSSLFRIIVKARSPRDMPRARQAIQRIIATRHEGEEDITVISQDALIGTFDKILTILTWTLAAIAAISLIVAGILIMNVMLVSVSQRQAEIGLLKALGAPTRQVLTLFLGEALLLSVSGGVIGLALGVAGVWALRLAFPDFPVQTPLWAFGASALVIVLTGLIFGSVPARQAARLDPVVALSSRL